MISEINENIADILKNLLLISHTPVKTLAENIGVSERTVYHWLTHYCAIGFKYACRLSDFFRIRIDELLGREELSFFSEYVLTHYNLPIPETQYQHIKQCFTKLTQEELSRMQANFPNYTLPTSSSIEQPK